ncbi:hypothetical protein LQ757_12750 [Agromyces sp. SYSU K20354]|uniref:hypothetical protein n=1 Tax=Agromyces cavernae TaxID=2898659 RepID=UPI001E620E33|nr:hypothetical protein [Agromyces cavernae]MCD2443145.1 hypothetical protein [Agromyces cavernae]
MATDSAQAEAVPWYLRGKTMIIGAGAVAAAALAIFGLWDRLFPPDLADVATVESIDLIRASSLHDFTSIGREFPLAPSSGDASGGPSIELTAVMVPTPAAPQESPVDPLLPPPIDAPVAPDAPADPIEAPTDDPGPTPDPDPATEPPTPAPSPTASGTMIDPQRYLPSDEYLSTMTSDPELDEYIPGDVSKLAAFQIQPTDTEGGEELPPDELASRLSEALSVVEAAAVDGKADPQGWTIAVSLRLGGLEGVPLLLTWSLDGGEVPVTWSADNVAYRVVPDTPDDTGSAEIWVPDLQAPGDYRVNVKIYRESDLSPIAHGTPLAIPNE